MSELMHEGCIGVMPMPGPNQAIRGAMRFLRAPDGTVQAMRDEYMPMHQALSLGMFLKLEADDPLQLYDPIHPWEDVGVTKTGIWATETPGVYKTSIAEPRFIRKTCDMPFFMGETFDLLIAYQGMVRRSAKEIRENPSGGTHAGRLMWRALESCSITPRHLEWMQGDEVKEKFRRTGEPTSIPIEFQVGS